MLTAANLIGMHNSEKLMTKLEKMGILLVTYYHIYMISLDIRYYLFLINT